MARQTGRGLGVLIVLGSPAWLACGGAVIVEAPTDRAPVSAIVVERGGTTRLRALEPVPSAIPVALDVDVDLLLYDEPLARLNVEIVDGELVEVAGTSPVSAFADSTPLPAPDRWLSGDVRAEVLSERDPAQLADVLGTLRVRRPACPSYVIDAVVDLPGLTVPRSMLTLSDDAVLVYADDDLRWVDTSTSRREIIPPGTYDPRYLLLARVGDARAWVASATVAGRVARPVWWLVDGDGRATSVPVAAEVPRPRATGGRALDGRWRVVAQNLGRVDEVDVERGTLRPIAAVADGSCALVGLTDDGRVLASTSSGLVAVPLDAGGEPEEFLTLSGSSCVAALARTSAVEAVLAARGRPVLYWRPRGERTWRQWRDEGVGLFGVVRHRDALYAATEQGPALLRVGRAPQLCALPVAAGGRQGVTVAGEHVVMVPAGPLFARTAAWVRALP